MERLDSKIDAIREELARQRIALASVETWRQSIKQQHDRLREQTEELDKRIRTQEEFTAGQKVYAAVAAVVCSVIVSGVVGLVFHMVRA